MILTVRVCCATHPDYLKVPQGGKKSESEIAEIINKKYDLTHSVYFHFGEFFKSLLVATTCVKGLWPS